MGQPNAKDVKRKSRISSASGNMGSRPVVRPSAYNDAVLLSATGAGPSSTSTVTPMRHGESYRPGSVGGGGGSTGVGRPASATASGLGGASVTSAPAASAAVNSHPVVLRYTDRDVQMLLERKKPVSVAVEALNWQPLPMTPSTDSFYALLELPAGVHNYRFIVDGKEVVDRTQTMAPTTRNAAMTGEPTTASSHGRGEDASEAGFVVDAPPPPLMPPRDGRPANTIYLNDLLLTTREDDDVMDDGKGWGQEMILFEETRKYPPVMPVHLRYTPLNTPPTLVRYARGGGAEGGGGDDADLRPPSEHLPLPLSVTINHVYFQRREDHAVVGVTTRYCNKFTTIVYYTPLPKNVDDMLSSSNNTTVNSTNRLPYAM